MRFFRQMVKHQRPGLLHHFRHMVREIPGAKNDSSTAHWESCRVDTESGRPGQAQFWLAESAEEKMDIPCVNYAYLSFSHEPSYKIGAFVSSTNRNYAVPQIWLRSKSFTSIYQSKILRHFLNLCNVMTKKSNSGDLMQVWSGNPHNKKGHYKRN